jgi:hypothetical protein
MLPGGYGRGTEMAENFQEVLESHIQELICKDLMELESCWLEGEVIQGEHRLNNANSTSNG